MSIPKQNILLQHCEMRNWCRDDIASLVENANDRAVWLRLRDVFPHPYTVADAEEWITTSSSAQSVSHFAIVVEGKAAGGIGLLLQSDVCRKSAEIGYWLGRRHWGRGIATEAVRAMTRYGFETFDVCRIYAHVFEGNTASARVLEKAGYQYEGRMRKAVFKDGKILDRLLYAVVSD